MTTGTDPRPATAPRTAMDALKELTEAAGVMLAAEDYQSSNERRLLRAAVAAQAFIEAEAGAAPSVDELDVERLARIRELQPEAVATLRKHGFVMDKLGPLSDDADELTRWKVLAFSLYTDIVEASTIAEHILEARTPRSRAPRPSSATG